MKPTVHYPPSRVTGRTRCCDKRQQEIRIGDRFASDPGMVTCRGAR